MSENILEGAYVGIGVEKMRRKAVPKGVAGDSFGDEYLIMPSLCMSSSEAESWVSECDGVRPKAVKSAFHCPLEDGSL